MQNLIGYSITVCFLLMYIFGLAGYIYGGNGTQGNILLNVPMERRQSSSSNGDDYENDADYNIFLLGRIGCGITIMLVMPMTLLPCREALLEVVDVRFHRSHHRSESGNAREETCCWKLFHEYNSSESVRDAEITTEDELLVISSPMLGTGPSSSTTIQQLANNTQTHDIEEDPHHHHNLERQHSFTVLLRHDTIQKDYIFRNSLAHYGSTLLITASCYLGAVAVRGVAVVWSFIGSSMAFLIAFILPCGCFIVMESAVPTVAEGGDRKEKWIGVAWMILVFSMIGTVVCTINNTVGFKAG